MPDDQSPDNPQDAADEPTPEATPPAGTPSVPPSEPAGAGGAPTDTAPATAEGAPPQAPRSRWASPGTATGAEVGAAAAVAAGTPRHAAKSRWASLPRAWVIAIVSLVVVVAGAGIALAVTSGTPKKHTPAAARPPASAATNIPAVARPACPLTGEPAPGSQVPARPALAFKVDNYPTARPQSGLTSADIVFEEPVEGGITRLVAVFQCHSADLVGPIRSARAPDVPILDQLSKPLLVHAGGINPVINLLNNANLINDDVFTHGSIIQHLPGRYAPYNTYASTSAAWALNAFDISPPAPLYTYSTTAPTGTAVSLVHIPFSSTNDNVWSWNPLIGQWQLAIGGVPANIAGGGGRISVSDIVVQMVHITYGPWLENSQGGLEVQAQMVGFGAVSVFRNGEEITGSWQRGSLADTTKLVAADGSAIALQPGRTWVELVPSTIPVTTTASAPAVPPATSPTH